MTNEDLVMLYQRGYKKALDELIENNKGMVCKIVNTYYVTKTNSIDREDLEQEGYMGLMMAAEKYKFDVENPCKFITYAMYWVNARVSRFVKTRNTNDETSLNTPIGDDGKAELQDFIEDKDYSFENIEEQMYREELRDELEEVMNKFNALMEREILKFHYGWDNGGKEMTYRGIGELFNITGENARQIENNALRKIRCTKWARLKAKELCHERGLRNSWSIPGTIEKINFAESYLMWGVMSNE